MTAARTAILSLVLSGSLAATACSHLSRTELTREIAARCAPVNALLSKNLAVSASVRTLPFGTDGTFSQTGAILESEHADRARALDAACRSWVSGATSDEAYNDMLLAQIGGSISLTSPPDEYGERINQVLSDLRAIQTSLPGLLSAERIEAEIARLNVLPGEEVLRLMQQSAREVNVQGEQQRAFETVVVARFDAIDQRLDGLSRRDSQQTPQDTNAAVESVTVYFATGSSELTHQAELDLALAAVHWRQASVVVSVVAYADPRGSESINQLLSQRRADRVTDFLRSNGLSVTASSGRGELSEFGEVSRLRRAVAVAAPTTD
jgi:outer membrane protein OmpA-like peptidoglycan-associated protein